MKSDKYLFPIIIPIKNSIINASAYCIINHNPFDCKLYIYAQPMIFSVNSLYFIDVYSSDYDLLAN